MSEGVREGGIRSGDRLWLSPASLLRPDRYTIATTPPTTLLDTPLWPVSYRPLCQPGGRAMDSESGGTDGAAEDDY